MSSYDQFYHIFISFYKPANLTGQYNLIATAESDR